MIHLTLRNGLCRHIKKMFNRQKGVMTFAFSIRDYMLGSQKKNLINLCADIELLKINRACIVFFFCFFVYFMYLNNNVK